MSTQAQYIAILKKRKENLRSELPLRIAAQTTFAARIKRVFDTGAVAKGYNKTQELWASDKSLRSAGTHRGKTGKPTKTSYYKSYYDLKSQQNFDPNTVNFRMTNDLQSDWANSGQPGTTGPLEKEGDNVFLEVLRRDKNVGKMEGLIKKFGDFTLFTQSDRELFQETYEVEMNKLVA